MKDEFDAHLERLKEDLNKVIESFKKIEESSRRITEQLERDSNEVKSLSETGLFIQEFPDTENVKLCYSIMTRKAARLYGTNIYIKKSVDSYYFVTATKVPGSKPKMKRITKEEAFESVPEHLKKEAIFNMNLFS